MDVVRRRVSLRSLPDFPGLTSLESLQASVILHKCCRYASTVGADIRSSGSSALVLPPGRAADSLAGVSSLTAGIPAAVCLGAEDEQVLS